MRMLARQQEEELRTAIEEAMFDVAWSRLSSARQGRHLEVPAAVASQVRGRRLFDTAEWPLPTEDR
jgi:hypothetical protein